MSDYEDYDDYQDYEEYSHHHDIIFETDDYSNLNFNELILQFEYDSSLNRGKSPNYTAYLFYKIIFHYCITKINDIQTIFSNERLGRYPYNRIAIDSDSDLNFITSLLHKIMITETKITCIIIDLEPREDVDTGHTTLLIYRPDMNRLEHYDPDGVYSFGFTEKFEEVINNLKSLNNELVFVSSKELHGFENFDDEYAYTRSLNFISSTYSRENVGWCQIWSLFVYFIVTKYHDIPTKSLLNKLFFYLKGPDDNKNKYVKSAQMALNIIHGFYIYLISELNKLHPDINLTYGSLNSYNPLYIYSNRKLNERIEIEMQSRVKHVFG